MNRISILAAALALAGCATTGFGTADCKTSDWYRLGLRDGNVSGRSSLEEYRAQCAPAGVTPDAALYARGFEAGAWERAHRRF